MRLERDVEGFDYRGKKRQRMPYILHYECPECGAEQERSFKKHLYLSYPDWGESKEIVLHCGECDTEEIKTVEIVPKLEMEFFDTEGDE